MGFGFGSRQNLANKGTDSQERAQPSEKNAQNIYISRERERERERESENHLLLSQRQQKQQSKRKEKSPHEQNGGTSDQIDGDRKHTRQQIYNK